MRYPKSEILTLAKRHGLNPKIYEILRAKLYGYLREKRKEFHSLSDYKSLLHYTTRPKFLVVSRNYIIVGKDKERSDNGLIIGVTKEGQIFVNWVSISFTEYELERLLEKGVKEIEYVRVKDEIEVYKTIDKVIWEILGYENEVSNKGKLMENVRYRVQGDIRLFYQKYNSFIDEIAPRLNDQVGQWLELVILRRVRRVLENYGLTTELNRNELGNLQLLLWGISRKWSYEEVLEIQRKIGKILSEELYLSDIIPIRHIVVKEIVTSPYGDYPKDVYVLFYSCEKELITKDRRSDINIRMTVGNGFWGFPYLPIIIRIGVNSKVVVGWVYKILRESEDQIKELEGKHRILRGRHLIEYYGYPLQFTIVYNPKFIENSLENDATIFSVNCGAIYTTKPTIRLVHPEHGEIKLKMLTDKCRVSINTIATMERDNDLIIARRNSYILSEWARQ